MSGTTTRPYVRADLDRCVAVWLAALQARDRAAPPPGTAERVRLRLEREDQWTVVAEHAGAVVGFVTVLPDGPDSLLLHHLAVHPAMGGRGLGGRLLASAVGHAHGRRVRLDVRVGNAAAIALYERAGFRRIGEPGPHPLGGEPMVRFERPPDA